MLLLLGRDLGIFSGFHGISWDSCVFLNKISDLSFDILVRTCKAAKTYSVVCENLKKGVRKMVQGKRAFKLLESY